MIIKLLQAIDSIRISSAADIETVSRVTAAALISSQTLSVQRKMFLKRPLLIMLAIWIPVLLWSINSTNPRANQVIFEHMRKIH